jgi:broad specificity phosphatase PhoE
VTLDLLLLRHGQSEGNELGRFGGHSPTPLTALGRAQAEAVARALALEPPLSAIYASDLPRAVDTALPVQAATGVRLVTSPALRERSVGEMTGLTFREAEERYPVEYAKMMRRDPTARPPGGETYGECTARARAFIDEAMARHPGGRVLIVAHGVMLHLLVASLLGLDPRHHIRTDNCGLHRLRLAPEGLWSVLALNDRAHLIGVTA